MSVNRGKWPVYEEMFIQSQHIYRTTYVNRELELIINTKKCKTCKQCVKACPREALIMPQIPKGTKVSLEDRMPIMPSPSKCVHCGVCMILCPFNAISMKNDTHLVSPSDLNLISNGILPKFKTVKLRKVELVTEEFSNPFWLKVKQRIAEK